MPTGSCILLHFHVSAALSPNLGSLLVLIIMVLISNVGEQLEFHLHFYHVISAKKTDLKKCVQASTSDQGGRSYKTASVRVVDVLTDSLVSLTFDLWILTLAVEVMSGIVL